MAKLLREKYKTYEGARKRAGFENGVARSEFKNGYKARHYHYTIVMEGDGWRVQRNNRTETVLTTGGSNANP